MIFLPFAVDAVANRTRFPGGTKRSRVCLQVRHKLTNNNVFKKGKKMFISFRHTFILLLLAKFSFIQTKHHFKLWFYSLCIEDSRNVSPAISAVWKISNHSWNVVRQRWEPTRLVTWSQNRLQALNQKCPDEPQSGKEQNINPIHHSNGCVLWNH